MTCNTTIQCDLAILGGGPGGFDAAMAAAAQSLATVLVEKDALGGTCLNRGCIPTKLFLGATAAIPELKAQTKLKLLQIPESLNFNMQTLQQRKNRVVGGSRKGMATQLKNAGVQHVQGLGRLIGDNMLEVTDADGDITCVAFKNLIIATGSRPAAFPGLEPDGQAVLNSDQLLDVEEIPESLIVVGAGAIGLEMAEFFSRLGTNITLVEGMDRLAPAEDPDISASLAKILKRDGWKLHVGQKVASLKTVDGQAELTLESGDVLTASRALVAVGRLPNSNSIGLKNASIQTAGPGWIQTDEHLACKQSDAGNIFAIGDVNGRMLLAHAASHQAKYVVRRIIINDTPPYDMGTMPSCVYGTHEIMRAGKSVAELQAAGAQVSVSQCQLVSNPIAQSHASTHGFIKVIWSGDRVRGITGLGHGVSHLVLQASMLVSQEARVEDIEGIIFPHPTLDEALEQALLSARKNI